MTALLIQLPDVWGDGIFLAMVIIGVVISIFIDAGDRKSKVDINVQYLIYSLAVSIGWAIFMGIWHEHGGLGKFKFYGYTLAGSSFAPSVVYMGRENVPKIFWDAIKKIVNNKTDGHG